jgi:hypothetical protein
MSSSELTPAIRQRLKAIDLQNAVYSQGRLRGQPMIEIKGGARRRAATETVAAHHVHGYERPPEHVRAHVVHAHTARAHESHRGATRYHVPEEHVREHEQHAYERHAGPVRGYEMPAHQVPIHHHIEDMTRRLQALETGHHARSHHAHHSEGGAVYGGAVYGGRHRKTDRPLTAYQLFAREHLHAARQRALAEGLSSRAASTAALRDIAAAWRAAH